MITLRSLPPGAMGPAPHRNPHRHDVDERERRRLRRATARTVRRAVAAVRGRRQPQPAAAPTLAD